MNSLIEVVQGLLERTYDCDSGVAQIGRFVIGDRGLRRFYGVAEVVEHVGSAAGAARTLVRESAGRLHASIYIPDEQLQALEAAPPQHGLGERNVAPFAALVEEVDHLLVLAERKREARGVSLFELELHANISKYLVLARFLAGAGGRLDEPRRLWLHRRLFDEPLRSMAPAVRQRYEDAERWAVRLIHGIRPLSPGERVSELRRFHRADAAGKIGRIRKLSA